MTNREASAAQRELGSSGALDSTTEALEKSLTESLW